MVTGVEQVWSRTGFIEPLEARWNAAVARLRKVSPGQPVGGPRTEIALDQIEAEIVRLTKPVAANDPALLTATGEVSDLEQRYHRAWLNLRSLQETLRKSARSPVHQLLNDVPDDAFGDCGPALDMSARSWPRFRSVREARSAAAELSARVLSMEGRAAQLVAAVNATSESPEILNRRLVMCLFDRLQVLERKIEQLSSQAPATNVPARARAEAAVAANPGMSDRAIAEKLRVGKDTVRRARKLTGASAPAKHKKGLNR